MEKRKTTSLVMMRPDGTLAEIRSDRLAPIVAYQDGVYQDCSFCGGRGCLACPGEAKKAVASGRLDENFSKPNPLAQGMAALDEFCAPYMDAWQAEQDALPEHKRGKPRYDEETKVYRDCPLCDGEGCEKCPEEADKEYHRQFPNGWRSALIAEIPRL